MNPNTSTKTTDYSQNAGYRAHRHIANGDTLVIYNAEEFGFISTPTERWIVMYEPASLHLMTRTLKEAQSIMRDAAQHPDEYFEPEAVALNRRREDIAPPKRDDARCAYRLGEIVWVNFIDPRSAEVVAQHYRPNRDTYYTVRILNGDYEKRVNEMLLESAD